VARPHGSKYAANAAYRRNAAKANTLEKMSQRLVQQQMYRGASV